MLEELQEVYHIGTSEGWDDETRPSGSRPTISVAAPTESTAGGAPGVRNRQHFSPPTDILGSLAPFRAAEGRTPVVDAPVVEEEIWPVSPPAASASGPPKVKVVGEPRPRPEPAEGEVVNLEDPKAAAPEPSQPSQPVSEPSQPEQKEYQQQQQQAARGAAASGAVVAAKSAASSAEEVPPYSVPDSYQGDPEERRHIICRPQGLRPLEEFCVCIDFHNVLDLGNSSRFLAVDQRTVGALRELLVDCAPVRLHICSFSGRAQAQYYWEENIIPCLDQLREAVSSPTIRVTAQQCFQRTGEGGKIHTLSTLEPRRPHVIIDDNAEICKGARRTNALVVQVNKRLGVIGLVDELRVLRNTIQYYNRDHLYPAFVLPPHRYLPNS